MTTTAEPETAMGNVPGIVVPRPPEQAARILGTGIEVWEVIKTFLEVGQDMQQLRRAFNWLTEAQLRAAFEYANEHQEAILTRIRADYRHLPEDEIPPIAL